ncbi:MAG: nucleotide exchange factor GrpE, partial [Rubrivivax sp.]|nr:nucleotide exchange factor GrpE [Rubrivivax sp.]
MNPTPETPAPATEGAAAGPASAAATESPMPLEAQLADLQSRHAEVADAYLRAKADAENTRRRADEEMSKARKFAVEPYAESLLPVKDSLEAAIAIPDPTPPQMLEGDHLTLRQLTQALER